MCLIIAVNRPDTVLAKGEHEGFEWVVTHNDMGFRCGYVRVPLGHPWHGKGYDDVECDVHGGLTFAHADHACGKEGRDENGYWVGFDTAHCDDAQDPVLMAKLPEAKRYYMRMTGTIRTQEYVENECRSLCEQAKKAAL